MDPNRFDSLTRLFATRRLSRRAALASAAGLLAAADARQEAGAQVSQAQCGNKVCAANPGVCTNGCVCCVYSNGNSRCRPPGTCSPGTEVSGTATAAPTTAAPTTTTTTTTQAPTTTTTTTTPRPLGTCPGLADGAPCGDGGIGRCDDGRCFLIAPNCFPCGSNDGAFQAANLEAGILFCGPFGGSVYDTQCSSSGDCPPGQSCSGPFPGNGLKLCGDACPA